MKSPSRDKARADAAISSNQASWRNLSIASEPDQIRLGGARVLCIDGSKAARRIAKQEPAEVTRIDWVKLARELGLTDRESQVLMLVWRDGVPVSHLGPELGITRYAASKAYATVRSRLGIGRQVIVGCLTIERALDSSRLTYRDRGVGTAAGPYSLGRLHSSFVEVMRKEKSDLYSSRYQVDPIYQQVQQTKFQQNDAFLRRRYREAILKDQQQQQLEAQLRTERLKFDKVASQSGDVRDAVDKAETTLSAARSALRLDCEESLLNERKPDANLRKRADAAELEFAAVSERAKVHAGAVLRQRAIVEQLEGELAANARAHAIGLIRPQADRIGSLMNEAGILAAGIVRDSSGQNFMPGDLFSGDQTEQMLRSRVLDSLLALQRYRSMFDRSAVA